jgi:hypothetical protein
MSLGSSLITVAEMKLGVCDMWRVTEENLLESFEFFYIPEPNSGCWIWMGTLMGDGYGQVGWKIVGGLCLAHRLSWKLFRGPLLDEEQVLHHCDMRCCVNPDHLFKGDNRINMSDRNTKNRQSKGENHGKAKLTESQAIAIINDPRSQYEIARDYGIHYTAVGNIKRGKKWKHLDMYRRK